VRRLTYTGGFARDVSAARRVHLEGRLTFAAATATVANILTDVPIDVDEYSRMTFGGHHAACLYIRAWAADARRWLLCWHSAIRTTLTCTAASARAACAICRRLRTGVGSVAVCYLACLLVSTMLCCCALAFVYRLCLDFGVWAGMWFLASVSIAFLALIHFPFYHPTILSLNRVVRSNKRTGV